MCLRVLVYLSLLPMFVGAMGPVTHGLFCSLIFLEQAIQEWRVMMMMMTMMTTVVDTVMISTTEAGGVPDQG